jgi:parafibromin
MTDSLLALRNAIKSKSPITYSKDSSPVLSLSQATHLVIASTPYPKSSSTRFRKPDSTDVYSLEAIYLAWSLKHLTSAEYVKQCRENGVNVGFVSVTDRKSVNEWLEGNAPEDSRFVPAGEWFLYYIVALRENWL